MTDGLPIRSWDSVCKDCAQLCGGICLAQLTTAGGDDCIAAICEGFMPKEKGDA